MTIPVMLGMFAEFIVNIINSAFMSRIDGYSFAAVGNAGLLYVSVMMIAYGIAGAAQIIIARREGEKDYQGISTIMMNNFFIIAILNSLIFIFFQLFAPAIFSATIENSVIGQKMDSFLSIRSFGIFFSILEFGFFAYYTGIGKTMPVMFATIVQGATNFLFDYALMFGHFGFPEMGMEGAAWSTVISDGFAALTYLLCFIFFEKEKHIQKFFKNKINAKKLREIIHLGLPLIGQGFVSVGAWTIFFFLIEHLGQEQLEVSQTIRSFYYLCLAAVLAFGTTTKTMVSKMIAEKRQNEIKPMIFKIILLSLGVTFIASHANFFYPKIAIPIININENVLSDTVLTLRLVSTAMLLFSISMVLTNVIAGSGDTKTSFLIEFAAIVIYLIVAFFITVIYPQPIYIVWCVEYVYFSIMIVASLLYLKSDKWRSIKV